MLSLRLVRFLAHRAADAYVVEPKGAEVLKDKWGQIRGFVEVDDTAVLIAIAGTKSVRDFMIDGNALKRHVLDFRVHAGFWGEYESLRMAIARVLMDNPGKLVRICGHSLGGALALLAAAEAAALRRDVQLVTLGCPRVGDWAFTRHLKRMGVKHLRVVHGFDVVPRIPKWFYWHYGELFHLDSNGRRIGAARKPFHYLASLVGILWAWLTRETIRDHFVAHYLDAIEKHFDLKGGDS